MFIIYEFLFNRVSVASGGQPNERSSIEPELLLDTLRSKGATGAIERHLKSQFAFFQS